MAEDTSIGLVFLSQALLVGLALLSLLLAPGSHRAWRALAIVAAFLAIAGAAAAGIWVYPPVWIMAPIGLLFVILANRAWRCAPSRTRLNAFISAAASLGLASLGGVLVWHGVAGRLAPSAPRLDLVAPLRGPGFCAVSGGASPVLNFHYATLAHGFEAFRGQSYGVDIVRISPSGLRTVDRSWWQAQPSAPVAYRIFGAEVLAPCSGRVLAARDGLPDHAAGMRDRAHLAGNHVLLACGAHEVLLAHLRQGSVVVRPGDMVSVGEALGTVGNSGASDEPHLHVSAAQSAPDGGLGGAPVHISFDGRFLSRGACLP